MCYGHVFAQAPSVHRMGLLWPHLLNNDRDGDRMSFNPMYDVEVGMNHRHIANPYGHDQGASHFAQINAAKAYWQRMEDTINKVLDEREEKAQMTHPYIEAVVAQVLAGSEDEMTCPACQRTITIYDGEEMCPECGWADESTLK